MPAQHQAKRKPTPKSSSVRRPPARITTPVSLPAQLQQRLGNSGAQGLLQSAATQPLNAANTTMQAGPAAIQRQEMEEEEDLQMKAGPAAIQRQEMEEEELQPTSAQPQDAATPPVQAKLTVGQPDDLYEREADAAAQRVMAGQPVETISRIPTGGIGQSVQQQPEPEEEEGSVQMQEAAEDEELQMTALQQQEMEQPVQTQTEDDDELPAPAVRRQEMEEEEPIQRQSRVGPAQCTCENCRKEAQLQVEESERDEIVYGKPRADSLTLDTRTAENAIARSGAGVPSDASLQSKMEGAFDSDFSDVRVHTGTAAQEAAQALNARAFTRGSDIYLASNESVNDARLMAHEHAHVVQQGTGAFPSTAVSLVQRTCGRRNLMPPPSGCTPTSRTPSSNRYLFDAGCDDFAPGEKSRLVADIKSLPAGTKVHIVGLASSDGPVDLNESLSCWRAESARKALAPLAQTGAGGMIGTVKAAGPMGPPGDATFRAVAVEFAPRLASLALTQGRATDLRAREELVPTGKRRGSFRGFSSERDARSFAEQQHPGLFVIVEDYGKKYHVYDTRIHIDSLSTIKRMTPYISKAYLRVVDLVHNPTPELPSVEGTDRAKAFCLKPNSFAVRVREIAGLNQDYQATKKGESVIKFEGLSSGRNNMQKSCSCECGSYRQFIRGYYRKDSKNSQKMYDVNVYDTPMTLSETNFKKEKGMANNVTKVDCKWEATDQPGPTSPEGYYDLRYEFLFEIFDKCQGISVATKQYTLTIEGEGFDRNIEWKETERF